MKLYVHKSLCFDANMSAYACGFLESGLQKQNCKHTFTRTFKEIRIMYFVFVP